jgi:hypothetical protein
MQRTGGLQIEHVELQRPRVQVWFANMEEIRVVVSAKQVVG